jgi:hypothetical protein
MNGARSLGWVSCFNRGVDAPGLMRQSPPVFHPFHAAHAALPQPDDEAAQPGTGLRAAHSCLLPRDPVSLQAACFSNVYQAKSLLNGLWISASPHLAGYDPHIPL